MPFIAWLTKCIGSWVQFIRISERAGAGAVGLQVSVSRVGFASISFLIGAQNR